MSQSNHFYFCFCLKKITIQGNIAFSLPEWTSFKLQLYRNQHFISTTKNIYCAPNQLGELILQQQTFTFSLTQFYETGRQVCQIRLLQLSQQYPEKVIGCYQFILNNYIKAYQEFNRNCIQLNVQIAQNFIILYDVFLEKTEQALTKIIDQHQTAIKYHMQQSNISQIGNFFPEQLENSKDDIFKFIKIDQANPHLYGQKYSSSKKIKRYASIVSKASKNHDQEQNMISSVSTQPSRILHKRLKKTISTSQNIFKHSQPCSINQIELESDPEVEDRLKASSQLYKVIENESKIIEPQQLLIRPSQQQPTKEVQSINTNVKSKRSIKRFIAPITIFLLIILVVALFLVISDLFKTTRNRSKSSKMQFQFHKFSSFVAPKSFS